MVTALLTRGKNASDTAAKLSVIDFSPELESSYFLFNSFVKGTSTPFLNE